MSTQRDPSAEDIIDKNSISPWSKPPNSLRDGFSADFPFRTSYVYFERWFTGYMEFELYSRDKDAGSGHRPRHIRTDAGPQALTLGPLGAPPVLTQQPDTGYYYAARRADFKSKLDNVRVERQSGRSGYCYDAAELELAYQVSLARYHLYQTAFSFADVELQPAFQGMSRGVPRGQWPFKKALQRHNDRPSVFVENFVMNERPGVRSAYPSEFLPAFILGKSFGSVTRDLPQILTIHKLMQFIPPIEAKSGCTALDYSDKGFHEALLASFKSEPAERLPLPGVVPRAPDAAFPHPDLVLTERMASRPLDQTGLLPIADLLTLPAPLFAEEQTSQPVDSFVTDLGVVFKPRLRDVPAAARVPGVAVNCGGEGATTAQALTQVLQAAARRAPVQMETNVPASPLEFIQWLVVLVEAAVTDAHMHLSLCGLAEAYYSDLIRWGALVTRSMPDLPATPTPFLITAGSTCKTAVDGCPPNQSLASKDPQYEELLRLYLGPQGLANASHNVPGVKTPELLCAPQKTNDNSAQEIKKNPLGNSINLDVIPPSYFATPASVQDETLVQTQKQQFVLASRHQFGFGMQPGAQLGGGLTVAKMGREEDAYSTRTATDAWRSVGSCLHGIVGTDGRVRFSGYAVRTEQIALPPESPSPQPRSDRSPIRSPSPIEEDYTPPDASARQRARMRGKQRRIIRSDPEPPKPRGTPARNITGTTQVLLHNLTQRNTPGSSKTVSQQRQRQARTNELAFFGSEDLFSSRLDLAFKPIEPTQFPQLLDMTKQHEQQTRSDRDYQGQSFLYRWSIEDALINIAAEKHRQRQMGQLPQTLPPITLEEAAVLVPPPNEIQGETELQRLINEKSDRLNEIAARNREMYDLLIATLGEGTEIQGMDMAMMADRQRAVNVRQIVSRWNNATSNTVNARGRARHTESDRVKRADRSMMKVLECVFLSTQRHPADDMITAPIEGVTAAEGDTMRAEDSMIDADDIVFQDENLGVTSSHMLPDNDSVLHRATRSQGHGFHRFGALGQLVEMDDTFEILAPVENGAPADLAPQGDIPRLYSEADAQLRTQGTTLFPWLVLQDEPTFSTPLRLGITEFSDRFSQ